MKKMMFLLLLFINTIALAQKTGITEKKLISEKVNLFFKALETKDTALYSTLVFPESQIWIVYKQNDTLKTSTRTFQRDMANLGKNTRVIEERPFMMDIKIHNDIAIAWVPYRLSISGKFSHCGIDVFTFLKTSDGWKIVSLSFSVEPNGCSALKSKYRIAK